MAAGNMVGGTASVAATSGTYDIKPGVGVEWVIHNIYNLTSGQSVTLAMYDGTNLVTFDTLNAGDARLGMTTHVSNTYWLRISNSNASAATIAYDGIQTV